MANIRFNIDKKGTTGYIFLIYYCSPTDRLKYSIGEKLPVKDWDAKNNRARPGYKHATSINTLLAELSLFIDRTRHEWKIKGERLSSSSLKMAIENRLYGNPENRFNEYARKWLEQKAFKKPDTWRSYNNMIVKLDKLCPNMTFDEVNNKWREKLLQQLSDYKQNYIQSLLKKFKSVMQAAYIDEIHTNKFHMSSKFVPASEVVDTIYLNMDQLNHIYAHLDTLNDTSRNAMILFLIGAFTGQRYQTYSKINKNMIIVRGDVRMITTTTEKTGQRVTIPVSEKLESLLDMDYKVYTNQKVNQYIKEAAKALELKDWEKITSHTARRSFATNAVIAGMDISLIMKITGHTTEKEFRKYVRMDDILAAQKSAGLIKIIQDQ